MWRLTGRANWAGVEPQLHIDWLDDRSLLTLVGVDGRVKNVGSEIHFIGYESGVSPGAVGPFEKDEQSLGAYLQNTYWPVPFLGLNVGARLDVDSRFGEALSPRAAATASGFPAKHRAASCTNFAVAWMRSSWEAARCARMTRC